MKRLAALGIVIFTLGGCALFQSSPLRPVVEDKVGSEDIKPGDKRVGTLATVAQRRIVIVKFENAAFCAEPSPDAVDNLSAALSAALSGGTESITAKASLAASIATFAKQLFFRSQGLQLYRDGMFSLCNAFLNGAIDKTVFQEKQTKLLEAAEKLIAAELPHLQHMKVDPGATPTAPNPPVINPSQPAPSNTPSGGEHK